MRQIMEQLTLNPNLASLPTKVIAKILHARLRSVKRAVERMAAQQIAEQLVAAGAKLV